MCKEGKDDEKGKETSKEAKEIKEELNAAKEELRKRNKQLEAIKQGKLTHCNCLIEKPKNKRIVKRIVSQCL